MMSIFKKAMRKRIKLEIEDLNLKGIENGENIKILLKTNLAKAREELQITIDSMAENKNKRWILCTVYASLFGIIGAMFAIALFTANKAAFDRKPFDKKLE